MTTTTAPGSIAALETSALIKQIANQVDPPDTSGLLFPGQPTEPHPVAALRALTAIRIAADQHLAYFVARARQAGVAWADLVEPLSFPESETRCLHPESEGGAYGIIEPDGYFVNGRRNQHETEDSAPGMTVFWVAGGRNDQGVVWDCLSCGEEIADMGPWFHDPAEAELGHAEGCERFAATVAAWKAVTG